jgi:hypothetical protein
MDERSDNPRRRHDERGEWPEGPMGRNASTESVGDPESEDAASGAERGAAAGALTGALAGPAGIAVGAAAGAAAGAAHEAADDDESPETDYVADDPIIRPSSVGTGPTDPLIDPPTDENRDPQAPGGRG